MQTVFEEKCAIDNQAIAYNGELTSGDCGLNPNFESNKRTLIASRHLRNDSKSIQLELRYNSFQQKSCRFHQIFFYSIYRHDALGNDQSFIKRAKKHIRSSSCDVRMVRSSSQDGGHDDGTGNHSKSTISGARKISITHRRNNSKDYDENDFRHKLTHSRNASSGGGGNSAVIKYILNNTGGGGGSYGRSSTSKKHSRNHSYDQIYMPNNIKVDQELHNKFNKNLSRKNSRGYDVNMLKNTATKEIFLDNKFLFRKSSKDTNSDAAGNENGGGGGKYHSRTNSKDLSSALAKTIEFVEETANNVLRHRRTSSKDLAVQKASGSFLPITIEKSVRKQSQHKIDIELEQESALLRQNLSGDEVAVDDLSSE